MPLGSFSHPEEEASVGGSTERYEGRGRRLQSWKEIAAYLERDPRTVQRWEKTESLPVKRHIHSTGGSVYAYTGDLDDWLSRRTNAAESERLAEAPDLGAPVVSEPEPTQREARRIHPRTIGVGAATVAIFLAGAWFFLRPGPLRNRTTFEPIPLSSLPGDEVSPSFSPDGKQVAYAWSRPGSTRFQIVLKSVDGPEERQITPDRLNAFSPAISPNGRQLAFLSSETYNGPAAIWLTSLTGGEPVKLADTGSNPWPLFRNIAWMPKGDMLISLGRSTHAEMSALYLYSLDHRSPRKITNPSEGFDDCFPAISPDGKQLLFSRISRGTAALFNISLNRNAPRQEAGSERVLFQRLFANSSLLASCWEANGRTVFIASNVGSIGQLWRAVVRGQSINQPEKLASVQHSFRDIARAASSGALVLSLQITNTNLWKVSLADPTLPPEQYGGMIASTRDELAPRYSPDGSKLAYESNRSGAWQIWVAKRDGSSASPITRYSGPVTGSPDWSPDGRYIAFDTRIAGKAELFLVSSSGGEPKQLTKGNEPNVVPRWSRDGQWIYFASPGDSGTRQLWKIRPDGSGRVRITKDGGFSVDETPDGAWLYYTKGREAVTALWRKSLRDGNEMLVSASVLDRCFALGRKGVFFATTPDLNLPPAVEYQAYDAKAPILVRKLAKPLAWGLALSPDERELTYAERDSYGSDLQIVRDVR